MFPIKKSSNGFDMLPTEKATYKHTKMVHGKYTAIVCCPKCNHNTTLKDYKIESSGQVFPTFHCDGDDCDYQEFIKLKDWN